MPDEIKIFDDELNISPQNFDLGIVLCVLVIIVPFIGLIPHIGMHSFRDFIYGTLSVWMLIIFNKYLKNFKNKVLTRRSIKFVILNAALFFFTIVYYEIRSGNTERLQHSWWPVLTVVAGLLYGISAIWMLVIQIMLGKSLQQVKNDVIGLLKQLGLMYMYALPIAYVLFATIVFVVRFKNYNIGNTTLSIAGFVMEAIPSCLILLIFYRAKQFCSKQHFA